MLGEKADRDEERVHAGHEPRHRSEIILEAAKEVGPSLFFSLLIITISFLPVFVLGGESGRLFRPQAFTKTFSMAAAALLSVTIIPVLMVYFITARVLPKEWGRRNTLAITVAAMILPGDRMKALAGVASRNASLSLVDRHRLGNLRRHAVGPATHHSRGAKPSQPPLAVDL